MHLCLFLHSAASTTCGQTERSPSTPRRVSYLERRAWTSPSVVRFYFRNFSRSVGPKKQSTSLPSFVSLSLLWGGTLRPHLTFRYPSPNTHPLSLCAGKLPVALPTARRQLAEARPVLMGHSPVLSLRLCTQNYSHFLAPLHHSTVPSPKASITLF